jgi:predicted deacetylase
VLAAVQVVASIPMTLLVVPHWHRIKQPESHDFFSALERLQSQGCELALHGYTHLDEGPPPRHLLARFQRQVVTRSEGEFAGLGLEAARARLQAGIDWFGQRGWPLAGFVAPAWMMSGPAFGALSEFKFLYATRYREMVLLPDYLALHSPALVYTARNTVGDALVRAAVGLLAARLVEAPLVRLALHPADAHHPVTLQHAQKLIAALLREREPMTKAEFACQIRNDCVVCA